MLKNKVHSSVERKRRVSLKREKMNLIHTGDGNFWAGYPPLTYSSVSNLVRLFYVIHPSEVSEFFVSLILSEYAVETS